MCPVSLLIPFLPARELEQPIAVDLSGTRREAKADPSITPSGQPAPLPIAQTGAAPIFLDADRPIAEADAADLAGDSEAGRATMIVVGTLTIMPPSLGESNALLVFGDADLVSASVIDASAWAWKSPLSDGLPSAATRGTGPEGAENLQGSPQVDEFRPMSMPPLQSAGGTTDLGDVLEMFGNFDPSGGGTPPSGTPPAIEFSGGNTLQETDENGDPIPGKYYVEDPVAVGSVAFIQAAAPPGLAIQSYVWAQGTPYSSYISAAPTTTPSSGVHEVETNVATTMSTYSFIVDAQARNYTIQLSVHYTNGTSGLSTITFTSVRPTVQLYHTQQGTQTVTDTHVPDGATGTWVTAWLNPGIHIEATASTGQFTAGQFMLMQVINQSTKTWTDAGSVDYSYSNNGSMVYEDENENLSVQDYNGPLLDDPPLAYEFEYKGAAYYSFSLGPNLTMPEPAQPPDPAPDPPEAVDTPLFTRPANYRALSVSTSYSMYLMYKPAGPTAAQVWVALAAVDWSWSKSMTRPDDVWTTDPDTLQPEPTSRTPSGAAAFPRWVNLGSMFNASGTRLDPNLRL